RRAATHCPSDSPGAGAPSGSVRSAPAQKARPDPVSSTARTVLSVARAAAHSRRSRSSPRERLFILAARFRRTVSTAPFCSQVRFSYGMARPRYGKPQHSNGSRGAAPPGRTYALAVDETRAIPLDAVDESDREDSMIVNFSTRFDRLTMFAEPALALLGMLGHSARVPGAILAVELPSALARLRAALDESGHVPSPAPVARPDDEEGTAQR